MAKRAYFGSQTFAFLRDLRANNDRDWFTANRERYDRFVKEPLLDLIADLQPGLHAISRHVVADPRPVGGSMFRLHRDTRFSKDKSPYKTHAAAAFHHAAGGDGARPGFYLHLAPGEVLAGAGLWRPDPASLEVVREAIAESPKAWKRATAGVEVSGEALSRPPRGFAPDHPLIADIKRKSFITGRTFTEKGACAPTFLEALLSSYREATPLMRFLCRALAIPF